MSATVQRARPRGRVAATLVLGTGLGLALGVLPNARAAESGVTIDNRVYSPETVTVAVGDTVTWSNVSKEDHTVRGGPFNSPLLHPGERFSFTFTKAGTIKYTCDVHPMMKGAVKVK